MLSWPTRNPVTLRFGSTEAPYSPGSPHRGVDFAYIPDSTIYSPADATVILKPNNGNDGNGVYMYVDDLFVGMLHTSKYLVTNGQRVTVGQPLAIMGDSGFAQGVHLHFAVIRGGQYIDPLTVLSGGSGGEQDMSSRYDTVPTQADIKDHYEKRLFREPTPSELANPTQMTWGQILDDNVTELGKRLQAAEINAGYEVYAGKQLFVQKQG